MSNAAFAERLLRWFDQHGRHDLPWQHPRAAYRVWVSEVMLQQTQVATVVPYFERFMAQFPDVASLAAAALDEVLRLWAGLGYYARARNLHRAAQTIVDAHGGVFPQDFDAVSALPGIGPSTAGAILAQAHGQRHAILDGNVRRVLARHAGIEGWPGLPRVQAQLWDIAQTHLPHARLADYTQAIMDLGNAVCRARTPQCVDCPVRDDCVALREDRIATLPSARPARVRPLRQARLLLVINAQDEVLALRRPPSGIWGGLWCPPLLDAQDSLEAALQRAGAAPAGVDALGPLRHAFTHFDLELLPLRAGCDPRASALAETSGHAWLKLSEPGSWPGLPAPIRKLLEGLQQQASLPLSVLPSFASPPCPAPFIASSSTSKPKASTARPTPARSASASSKTSRRKPGSSGSSTRRG